MTWSHEETPYKVLGVNEAATPTQIKEAHRRLAALHHPDREGGDAERMALVNNAYDLLEDPVARRDYDLYYRPKCPRCKGTRVIKAISGFKVVKVRCPDCA